MKDNSGNILLIHSGVEVYVTLLVQLGDRILICFGLQDEQGLVRNPQSIKDRNLLSKDVFVLFFTFKVLEGILYICNKN